MTRLFKDEAPVHQTPGSGKGLKKIGARKKRRISMGYKDIMYVVEGPSAVVTIDRPQMKNAISLNTCTELANAFKQADDDPNARVIVLTHTGGYFTSGGDLSGYRGKPYMEFREYGLAFARLWNESMLKLKKPILAVLQGHVYGGGMGLVSACDMSIATDDIRFRCAEIDVGLWPFVVTPVLSRQVGVKKALELMMSGEAISASEAKEIGLINRLAPRGKLDQEAKRLVDTLASKSPLAMRMGKETVYSTAQMPYAEALEYAAQMLTLLTFSEDGQEGVNAFLQKRQASYKGY
jgi:enoyl-CoA hydratase/carnithine racemase